MKEFEHTNHTTLWITYNEMILIIRQGSMAAAVAMRSIGAPFACSNAMCIYVAAHNNITIIIIIII